MKIVFLLEKRFVLQEVLKEIEKKFQEINWWKFWRKMVENLCQVSVKIQIFCLLEKRLEAS
jgi:hypothetical protein